MPLLPPAMQGLIQAKAASVALAGSKFMDLAGAIANASCQYILMSSFVNSTNIALGPGAGTQTGTIQGLTPSGMSALMLAKAASQGLAGRDIRKLFDAVSFGVCNAMKTVMVQGTVIGAGPGTGTGKIVGLVPTALEAFLYAQGLAKMLSGTKYTALISAIAFGVCNHIMTVGTAQLTDIGAAAGPPAGPVTIPAAPGIGRLM